MLAKNLQGAALATQPAFIEDCFSSYLYTGNGSTQTITNGIDLAGKGGLVWLKSRSNATSNYLLDTARGGGLALSSDGTGGNITVIPALTFNANGFTSDSQTIFNGSARTYVSWTFREQAKFFDIVTYTGTGANRTISHNLGSVPGCIIVKRTDTSANWQVYHRSLANTEYIVLNSTAAKATGTTRWNSTTPTSTVFSLGTDSTVNANGGTYVAYLFAHDAGGFGASGSDNVISCGTYSVPASASNAPVINLGWEPQWLLIKSSSSAENWELFDNMRGLRTTTGATPVLVPNLSDAEASGGITYPTINPTGFQGVGTANTTYIYIAIRRGPMKTPTSGTSVFAARTFNGGASTSTISSIGFTPDASILEYRTDYNYPIFTSRMTGKGKLITNLTGAEDTTDTSWVVTDFDRSNSLRYNDYGGGNLSSRSGSWISWLFSRAPGFFDVVCYTGAGVDNRLISHNLGVAPELIIAKNRTNAWGWAVYCKYFSNNGIYRYALLNTTDAVQTSNVWSDTLSPTATTFPVSANVYVSQGGANHVAYLFATLPGVSKVGSYTGTGTTKQIDCGFTGGSRFVLIKRTDSTGDWYVWDSARGIVAGNDPYLLLNSTAAEVTGTDYVDTFAAGFEISSTAPAAINANGGTFIFLAIA